jgi:hypothetical protein
MKCDIAWCNQSSDLMRRKPGGDLYKRFGGATFCRMHVPVWRLDEYESLDEPSKAEPASPRAEFDKAGAAKRVVAKRAKRVEASEQKGKAPF